MKNFRIIFLALIALCGTWVTIGNGLFATNETPQEEVDLENIPPNQGPVRLDGKKLVCLNDLEVYAIIGADIDPAKIGAWSVTGGTTPAASGSSSAAVTWTETGKGEVQVMYDGSPVTCEVVVVELDLDIDSLNAGKLSPPTGEDDEDLAEAASGSKTYPGKLICLNKGDVDDDGVPNYADGIKDSKDTDRGANASDSFVPAKLKLHGREEFTDSSYKIVFTYTASDPSKVTKDADDAYVASSGALRLWLSDGKQERSAKTVVNSGDYIKSGDKIELSKIFGSASSDEVTLYVEGVKLSTGLADQSIKVELIEEGGDGTSTSSSSTVICTDLVKAMVIGTDLDIDSNNNDYTSTGENGPHPETERSLKEGQMEKIDSRFIHINNGDLDNDLVPDLAENHSKFALTGGSAYFTPMIVEIPHFGNNFTKSEIKLTLTYSASDPDDMTVSGDGTPQSPKIYSAASGAIRVWDRDADTYRDIHKVDGTELSGDYVSETGFTLDNLPEGVVSDESGSFIMTFYVEGINPAEELITSTVEYTFSTYVSFECADEVSVHVVGPDIDTDSNNTSEIGEYVSDEDFRSPAEDVIEAFPDDPRYPQRIVRVASRDFDGNGIPDFADQMDKFPEGTGTTMKLTEAVVELPSTVAQFKIIYSASDPDNISKETIEQPEGSNDKDITIYNLGEPSDPSSNGEVMRIWSIDDGSVRNIESIKDGGHFVKAEEIYSLSDFGGSSTTLTLYIEGVRKSENIADQLIRIEVDPDGNGPAPFMTYDQLRVTLVEQQVRFVHESTNNLTPSYSMSHPIQHHSSSARLFHHNQSLAFSAIDFSFPATSFSTLFARNYRDSYDKEDIGPMGHTWEHIYQERFEVGEQLKTLVKDEDYDSEELSESDLEQLVAGSRYIGLIYHDAAGRTTLLDINDDDTIDVPEGRYFKIEYNEPANEITLTETNGIVKVFKRDTGSAIYHLESIEDPFDQKIDFSYIYNRRFETIVENIEYPVGGRLDFHYYESEPEKDELLRQVEVSVGSAVGHTVEFTYAEGNLKSSIFRKPNNTKFSDITYDYSSNFLTKVTNKMNGEVVYDFSRNGDKVTETELGYTANRTLTTSRNGDIFNDINNVEHEYKTSKVSYINEEGVFVEAESPLAFEKRFGKGDAIVFKRCEFNQGKLSSEKSYGKTEDNLLGTTTYSYRSNGAGTSNDTRDGILVTTLTQTAGTEGEALQAGEGSYTTRVTYDGESKNFATKTVVEKTGRTVVYENNNSGFTTSKSYPDANGGTLTDRFTPDEYGRIKTYTPANGLMQTYDYSGTTGTLETTTSQIFANNNANTIKTKMLRNIYGSATEFTDPLNNITDYSSDGFGPRLTTTLPPTKAGDDDSRYTMEFTPTSDGVVSTSTKRVPVVTGGTVDNATYNKQAISTTRTVDSFGRPMNSSQPFQGQNPSSVVTYIPGTNLVEKIKHEDKTYTYIAYDDLGRETAKAVNVNEGFDINNINPGNLPSGAFVNITVYNENTGRVESSKHLGYGDTAAVTTTTYKHDKHSRNVEVKHLIPGYTDTTKYSQKEREIEEKTVRTSDNKVVFHQRYITDVSGLSSQLFDELEDSVAPELTTKIEPDKRKVSSTNALGDSASSQQVGLEQKDSNYDGTQTNLARDKNGNTKSYKAVGDARGDIVANYNPDNSINSYTEKDLSDAAQKVANSGFGVPNLTQDVDGVKSKQTLDEDGNVIATKEDDGGKNLITQNKTLVEDKVQWLFRDGQATKKIFDNGGQLLRCEYFYDFKSINNPGPRSFYEQWSYLSRGRVNTQRLRNGAVIKYHYDTKDRITKLTNNGKTLREFKNFNKFNQPEVLIEYGENGTYAIGQKYDDLGRLSEEEWPNGSVEYAYDRLDRIRSIKYPSGKIIEYIYNGSGPLDKIKNGDTVICDLDYNSLYNNLDRLHFQEKTVEWGYHSQKLGIVNNVNFVSGETRTNVQNHSISSIAFIDNTSQWSASNNRRTYNYDNLRRLKSVTAGDSSWDTFANTSLSLDNFDNIHGENTIDGEVRDFVVDQTRNQLKEMNGQSFTYDASGTLTGDDISSFKTDIWGRVIEVETVGMGGPIVVGLPKVSTFIYEKDPEDESQLMEVGEDGLISNVTLALDSDVGASGIQLFAGTDIIQTTGVFNNVTKTYSLTLSPPIISDRFQLKIPDAISENVKSGEINYLSRLAYNEVLEAPVVVNNNTSSPSFELSEPGNIKKITIILNQPLTTTDVEFILNSESIPAGVVISEDNLTVTIKPTGGYETTAVTVSFTESVNVASAEVLFLKYDANTQPSTETTKIEYVYDALGRRVKRIIDGVTYDCTYAGMQMLEDGQGNEYVYGTGINMVTAVYRGGDLINTITDERGSIFGLVKNKQLVTKYTYSAFGQRKAQYLTAEEVGIDFGLAGMHIERGSGYYHMHYRDYDPRTGRMNGEDPAGYQDGMNLYGAYFVLTGGQRAVDVWGLAKGTGPLLKLIDKMPGGSKISRYTKFMFLLKRVRKLPHLNNVKDGYLTFNKDFKPWLKKYKRVAVDPTLKLLNFSNHVYLHQFMKKGKKISVKAQVKMVFRGGGKKGHQDDLAEAWKLIIKKLNGAGANLSKAQIKKLKKYYTPHHHFDVNPNTMEGTMMLIPTGLHGRLNHVGGHSIASALRSLPQTYSMSWWGMIFAPHTTEAILNKTKVSHGISKDVVAEVTYNAKDILTELGALQKVNDDFNRFNANVAAGIWDGLLNMEYNAQFDPNIKYYFTIEGVEYLAYDAYQNGIWEFEPPAFELYE